MYCIYICTVYTLYIYICTVYICTVHILYIYMYCTYMYCTYICTVHTCTVIHCTYICTVYICTYTVYTYTVYTYTPHAMLVYIYIYCRYIPTHGTKRPRSEELLAHAENHLWSFWRGRWYTIDSHSGKWVKKYEAGQWNSTGQIMGKSMWKFCALSHELP